MLSVNNPNLSIIMPVGCNAKCSFCYWKKQCGLTEDKVQFVCDTLPDIFKQVSITGGEPTLSPNLSSYLKIVRDRFDKVVLNTNGYKLTKEHVDLVDHVNISRHHYEDGKNIEIFGVRSIPSTMDLIRLGSYGDITLNCVLEDGFKDRVFIDNYISFAKMVGAKVAFRKYFNNLNILNEIDKDDTLIDYHSCGACLHRRHKIKGVDVTYKYSVQETHEAIGGIYELILQANGDLTFDWEGKKVLTYKNK